MAKYVIKRVAYGVVTLFVLVSLTFFMQQLLPGDPFVGEKNLPEATMEALYAKYGLDKPVWMQYFIYLGNVLHGDLGISLQNDRPVTTVIGESFVVSFDVGIRAILFAFILGVVLGNALPAALVSALGVGLYGMFMAVFVPAARKDPVVLGLVAVSFAASYLVETLPLFAALSAGARIILLTVTLSLAAAILFPVKEDAYAA